MAAVERATSDAPSSPHRQIVPARYRLSVVCFFAAFFGYAQRYGLALAIVRMQAELDWDRSTQGRVLAALQEGEAAQRRETGHVQIGRFEGKTSQSEVREGGWQVGERPVDSRVRIGAAPAVAVCDGELAHTGDSSEDAAEKEPCVWRGKVDLGVSGDKSVNLQHAEPLEGNVECVVINPPNQSRG